MSRNPPLRTFHLRLLMQSLASLAIALPTVAYLDLDAVTGALDLVLPTRGCESAPSVPPLRSR